MEDHLFTRKPLSIGQKVERIRMFRGIKQEYMASRLGISQPQVSKIEQQEEIEESLLKQIAEILGVTPEAIRNFDEDRVTYNINNLYHIHDNEFNIHDNEMKDNASGSFNAQQFNESEKMIELYERLLKSERELSELKKNLNSTEQD